MLRSEQWTSPRLKTRVQPASASGGPRGRSLFNPGGAQMLLVKKDFLPPPLLLLFFFSVCFFVFFTSLFFFGSPGAALDDLFSLVILRVNHGSSSVWVQFSKRKKKKKPKHFGSLVGLRPVLKIFLSERLQNKFVNSIGEQIPPPAPTAQKEKPLFRRARM